MVSRYLGASSDGDDTCEEISDHRFQGDGQAVYMDGVDQTQTVLFNQGHRGQRSTKACHRARPIYSIYIHSEGW